ncbi:hypothetical protein FACS189472_16230 [Alphaproteobacteria bacterium]|nr:hypothetical protein FACS189472_16230 [Alphaproteobacteria bacterium]
MAESNRSEEGSLISGQDLQGKEPGASFGQSSEEQMLRRRRWSEH